MPKRPSVNNDNAQGAKVFKYNEPALLRAIAVLLAFLGAFIYVLEFTGLSLSVKVILALIIFVVGTDLLNRSGGLQEGIYGARMMRSYFGLKLIDRLSGIAAWFWNGLSDWGLVLGFGILSYFIFKKTLSKRMILFGILSIFVILIFVVPYYIVGLTYINIPGLSPRLQGIVSSLPSTNINYFADLPQVILVVLAGFVAWVIVALLYSAALILQAVGIAIITSLTSTPNYTLLSNSIPGVTLVLPGLNLPLIQGLMAFVIVLSVHEFAHGILCRIAKVKVLSTGLLVAGIVPMGAFVEPDEKAVVKVSPKLQNRIFAAGVATNMLFSLIFFIPTVLIVYLVLPYIQINHVVVLATVPNSPANSTIAPGAMILKWNGYNISTLSDFKVAAVGDKPGANVSVVTNQSSAILKANSTGKVGVDVQQITTTKPGLYPSTVMFLLPFFALTFLLNFLIAVFNYLPLPGFDGWRVFGLNIKSKKITFAVSAISLISIWLNTLPWVWILPYLGIPAVIIVGAIIFIAVRWLWGWTKTK